MTERELEEIFTYHAPPDKETTEFYEQMRSDALELALFMEHNIVRRREKDQLRLQSYKKLLYGQMLLWLYMELNYEATHAGHNYSHLDRKE